MNARQLIRQLTEEEELDVKSFLQKRQEGAAKVASDARSKGGPALLTAVHFEAKNEPYAESIREVEEPGGPDSMAENAEDALNQLAGWQGLTMDEFQQLTGKFEAWGECYLKSKASGVVKP